MQWHLLSLALLFPLANAFDCCSGHMCNENWDQFDQATGNCCMLPSGGRMLEQTAVGSCSCPSIQSCDKGPKPTERVPPPPPQTVPAPAPAQEQQPIEEPRKLRPFHYRSYGRHHKSSDPNHLLEIVLVVSSVFLGCGMCLVICVGLCGLWRMSSGYNEIKTQIERLPIAGAQRYPIADAKAMSVNSRQANPVMYHSYQQQLQNQPTREQVFALLQYVQAQQGYSEPNIQNYESESVRKSVAADADFPESRAESRIPTHHSA